MISQDKKQRRFLVLLSWLLFLLLCGCSLFPSVSARRTKTAPTVCGTPIVSNHLPKIIQVDVDTMPLYPQTYFRAVLSAVSTRVMQHVTLDSSPLTIFVSYITHDSLNQNAMSFTVPGLPALPAKPVLQTSPDPYQAARYRLNYQTALACWQKVVNGLQQEVTQVKAQVRVEADKMHNLSDLFDPISDDVDGALYNASEHLSHFQDVKYLYIASGLQSNTDINHVGNLNFNGVAVSVLDFFCHPASVCVETQTKFTQLFRRYGASSVNFYLPGVPESSELSF